MKVKVEDEKTLVRDMNTRAILSSDKPTLDMHRLQRKRIKSDKDRIKDLESRLEKLERLLINEF